ncbi:MAG: single-stranded DNA-binding protein [Candidatus Sericytochromatia bacterium]|nr:single-stranded DNA-binding protein [Candidatus Sericytochromatia bacterium]
MSVNQIVLVGTVDTDSQGVPHKGTTPSGYDMTRFRIKVVKASRSDQDVPRYDLFQVEVVGRQAELAAALRPGGLVAVEGRLRTYKDDHNATRVLVDASSVQPLAEGVAVASPASVRPSQVSAAPVQGSELSGFGPDDAGDFDGPYPF